MPEQQTPRPHRRLLKYAAYAFAVVTLALGGAVAYLLATFDARDYYHYAVDAVREKTGRTLDIKGEVALSFWPDVAVRLGAMTLSERDGGERFASVEGARVRMALRPLLRRELVASELVISGAIVRITRFEDGRLNIDDLLKGDEGPPRFDIARVAVERSALTFADLASGKRYELSDLALQTGRLAPGVTTPVSLAFAARDARDTAAMKLAVKGRLALDFENRRHALHEARVEASGRIGDLHDIVAKMSGDFAVAPRATEAGVHAFTLALEAKYGAEALSIVLESTSVQLGADSAVAQAPTFALAARGPAGKTDLKLAAGMFRRDADRVELPGATAEFAVERGTHAARGTIAGRVEGAIASRQVALTGLSAQITATGPRLPRGGVRSNVEGEARLDVLKQGLALRLAGAVAESRVKAQIVSAGFASPVYTFDLEVDRLDLDRYLSADLRPQRSTDPAADAQRPLLQAVANLPASGTINIGLLNASNTRARNVKLVLK
jgi:AsmA protein